MTKTQERIEKIRKDQKLREKMPDWYLKDNPEVCDLRFLLKAFDKTKDLAIKMWEEAEHRGGRMVVADKLVDKEINRMMR